MLNSGNYFRALRDKKNKCSNSRVVRKKNFGTKQKTITPPLFKLNGRSLNHSVIGNTEIELTCNVNILFVNRH